MEGALSADRLNKLFARTAMRQRSSDLVFSLVADLMGTVVCGVRPSIHAAFQARRDDIGISIKAFYGQAQEDRAARDPGIGPRHVGSPGGDY
jgi:hypothetical protein